VGWCAALALALGMVGATACSESVIVPTEITGDAAAATCPDSLNPDGVSYPCSASGYGHTPRSGATPGSVIADFFFQGRLAGSSEFSTVSLASYYDPCNKRYKILHLSVAAMWCVPCSEETTAVAADLASSGSVLRENEVVFVQALDDGPTVGAPATPMDLDQWITENNSNDFTEILDPALMNLGGFFNAAAVPWNADIDVRTMEILDSNEGWAGSVEMEVAGGIAALPAKPSYPIPSSAGCSG
jgi:hypothetical protein